MNERHVQAVMLGCCVDGLDTLYVSQLLHQSASLTYISLLMLTRSVSTTYDQEHALSIDESVGGYAI